jgi:hypothetical protein
VLEEEPVEPLGPVGDQTRLWRRVLDDVSVALAAELVGVADRALEEAVEYAKVRVVFDRPIASFQSVKHRIVDMYHALEMARAGVHFAAWAADTGAPERSRAATMAAAYASEAAVRVTGDNIQIHGGVGFTWANDAHFLFKRAKQNEVLMGGSSGHQWHRWPTSWSIGSDVARRGPGEPLPNSTSSCPSCGCRPTPWWPGPERPRKRASTGLALMDHLVTPGAPDHPVYEAFTTATWLAAATDRLRLGHLVLCDGFRHPAVLARQAVTLDHLSGGRFELGIGSGSTPAELVASGFDAGNAAQLGDAACTRRWSWSPGSGPVSRSTSRGVLPCRRGPPAARPAGQDPHRDRRHRSRDGGAGGPSTPTGGTCPSTTWTDGPAPRSVGGARVSMQVLVTLITDEPTHETVELAARRFGRMGEDGHLVGNGPRSWPACKRWPPKGWSGSMPGSPTSPHRRP